MSNTQVEEKRAVELTVVKNGDAVEIREHANEVSQELLEHSREVGKLVNSQHFKGPGLEELLKKIKMVDLVLVVRHFLRQVEAVMTKKGLKRSFECRT